MDDQRFDDLARAVHAHRTRRALALGAVAIALGGAAIRLGLDGAGAGKNRKKSKGKNKKKKNRPPTVLPPPCLACEGGKIRVPGSCDCCLAHGVECLFDPDCCTGDCFDGGPVGRFCRGRSWRGACRFDGDCAGGSCVSGECAPTCTDSEQNGSETDVDCGGGTCPRCASGKTCSSHVDCRGAFCAAGVCNTCSETVACASDQLGSCSCIYHAVTSERICVRGVGGGTSSCAECGDGVCARLGDGLACFARCGAP
jgi:hypothetical protein